MKKLLLLLITFLFVISIATGAVNHEQIQDLLEGNFFVNQGAKYQTSAFVNGWYPVANWEVETCTRDVTASFVQEAEANTGVFAQTSLIVDTTVTIQATKQSYGELTEEHDYEVAWYIHPFNNTITYNIQYKTDNGWRAIPDMDEREAGAQYGDRGYHSWATSENITTIRILSSDDDRLEVPVVPYE